jgi:hypothetical protein
MEARQVGAAGFPGRPALAIAALLTALSACCTLHPMPAVPVTDPSVLLDRLAQRKAAATTLSAVARIEVYSKQGVVKGRVTILADAAGRLRLDGWSPSDDLLTVLAADRDRFLYFERGAKGCLAGPSCRANVARMLPIGLDLPDAVLALFGLPPLVPAESPWSVAFDRKVGAYRVESRTADGVQRLWLLDDGTPVRAERTRGKTLVWNVQLEDFDDAGGARLPRRMRFRSDREDLDVSLRYRSVTVPADAEAEDWQFECPAGLPVNDLPCEEPR